MATASLQPLVSASYAATAPQEGVLSVDTHALCRVTSSTKAFTAEYTADATVDIDDVTDLFGSGTMSTVNFLVVELVKTASTSSGTCVITGAGVFDKLAATTINAGAAGALAALSGDSIYTYAMGLSDALDVTSGTNTIDFNFTTPVGFKARLTVVGT